jgi:hypothetical protein
MPRASHLLVYKQQEIIQTYCRIFGPDCPLPTILKKEETQVIQVNGKLWTITHLFKLENFNFPMIHVLVFLEVLLVS